MNAKTEKSRFLIPTYIFGSITLLFYFAVFWFFPSELPPFKQKMLGIISAILTGLFSYFMTGAISVHLNFSKMARMTVQAGGGIGIFVFVLWWWLLSPMAPIKPIDEGLELKPFKEKTFGILVAPFKETSDDIQKEGRKIRNTIQSTLKARFHKLGINDSEIQEIPVKIVNYIKDHEHARKIGKQYNAEFVVWGDITIAGIIPCITVVNEKSEALSYFKEGKSEHQIFNNSLTHAAIAQLNDIRLPPLTDDVTKLVSFVAGLRYYNSLFDDHILTRTLPENTEDKNQFQSEQSEKALELFKESLPEESVKAVNSSGIHFYIGDIYLLSVYDYDKAILHYTESITINPKYAETYYNNRGLAYGNKGDYDKAIADFNQAIEINPKVVEVYNNRGIDYFKKGEHDKAFADFNQAILIKPKYASAY